MNSNIVRAAQWIAVGMVCSSMLLLGGFYWISNHQQQRLLHELRGGSFGPTDSTLILPPISAVGTEEHAEPNERISQLLNQSEDFRTIQSEWQRMWSNDQPTHLTPERIHGGIQ